jgi:uncharacterized iron-regulated membrane protein
VRTLHRILALFVLIFALYLGTTGMLIQLTDLRTLLMHAPESDPNMKAIREGLNGTGDFQVIDVPDYAAPVLPGGFDYPGTLLRTLSAARAALQNAPLQYLELRSSAGRTVGVAKSSQRLLQIDAADGALLAESTPTRAAGGTFGRSQRNTFKGLHRMTSIGDWALSINILVGLSLCAMLVTGTAMYFRLLSARRRMRRSGLFWWAGGTWRSLHRAISFLAGLFLLVVALSGTWLAVESLGRSILGARERALAASGVQMEDPGAPLGDNELPAMLDATLRAYARTHGATPVRVLRLRIYGGMPQGVIVTGEPEARQLVFNAATGQRASLTEPGYPPQHFPFGWQAHQIAKQIHRGDIIGTTGRWMDLFAGLALLYLTVSGAVMYFELWQRRRKSGRGSLLWT